MFGILARILGTNNERQLKRMRPTVEKINALEPSITALSDEELRSKTADFKEQVARGRSLDDILPEAFAVVREAGRRFLGQRHYDVQLIGGIVLHQGKIAEMKTGEGKTLTATLALYLNSLSGKGAHLVTVNDYLARRDAEWMRPIYEGLGVTVTALQHGMSDEERQKAYQVDILYATNNELGFDYLRDNMKFRLEDYVQRDHTYAIVDEVDSILIDEARTPLIISGMAGELAELYVTANRAVETLEPTVDFEVDEKARSVQMTETGMDKMERFFSVENLYAIENLSLLHHINQALRAHAIFKRDVDYVVKGDEVLIVDEFTGRILGGRRYSDGLHQALEAKEGVKIKEESQTLASITLQNYFRLYKKLAGMTGTAATEAEEFHNIYKLDVISIPTNQPMIRLDKPDYIFLTRAAKYKAIVEDVLERYQKKQPVLIGTVAIETSELISGILKRSGIPHEVLNAKQHEREAEIVEHAGEAGRVTIATNMAGRGTDIKLTTESRQVGGLYILGTERHESRRIDNQLRGRSGRQGDPGESRFYLSLEDDLIRIFSGDTLRTYMQRLGMQEDEVIESRYVSKSIEGAQEKVEKDNFERRKHLLEYDDVMNQQRTVVYQYRRNALEGEENIHSVIREFITRSVEDIVAFYAPGKSIDNEMQVKIVEALHRLSGFETQQLAVVGMPITGKHNYITDITSYLLEQYQSARQVPESEAGLVKSQEKWLLLETIDEAWKQHMLNMDHLKEGINLRSWGQKNPLVEYKREAFAMFQEMMESMRNDVVRHIFHLGTLQHFNQGELESRRKRELDQLRMVGTPEAQSQPVIAKAVDKVGRNEACSCGSGKKSKRCCSK